jgi:hypothetical protein
VNVCLLVAAAKHSLSNIVTGSATLHYKATIGFYSDDRIPIEGPIMIPFTQYLRPDGRRRAAEIDRSVLPKSSGSHTNS